MPMSRGSKTEQQNEDQHPINRADIRRARAFERYPLAVLAV